MKSRIAVKSGKCAFQIDQFQGRPSPKNALALASKNRRRFASLAICLPKSLEAARLLRTVRTSRLGRQSASSSGNAVSRLSFTVTSGDEAGCGAATDKASVSAILATCLGSQKHSGGSGCGSWSNVLRWEPVREFESEIHKSLSLNNLQVLSLIKVDSLLARTYVGERRILGQAPSFLQPL